MRALHDVDASDTINVAPTKELVSLRMYSVTRRLNRLRRDACALFTGDDFVTMTNKLEREINCGRMSLRKDRNVFADLGTCTCTTTIRVVIVILIGILFIA